MTLVDTKTGEIVETTYGEVRESVRVARESGATFFEQIVWQIERQAWTLLGHESWDAMREAEYGDMGVVVPRADRPEIVTRMRRSGLTQQQIAETVGVSVGTVNSDLKLSSENEPAAPVRNSRGQERPASYTKTPAPAPEGEAGNEVEPAPEVRQEFPPAAPPVEPEPEVDLNDFIAASPDVALAGWRKNFMAAIARSGEVMRFTPDVVAEKADADLVDEVERLAAELNNYVSRINARRPVRLTAIRGGVQ